MDPGALDTWDDAIEAGKKIKARTGKYLLGIDKPASQADAANFFQLLLQLQGAFYFNLEGAITLDSPEAVKAMTVIKRMNDAGLVSDLAGGWTALMSSIKQGTAAVLPWPTWFGGVIEETVPEEAGKWAVRLPPAMRRGGSTAATVNSTHLAINGSSTQQAAAWTFIEYVLTRPESQVAIYRGKGIAPRPAQGLRGPGLPHHLALLPRAAQGRGLPGGAQGALTGLQLHLRLRPRPQGGDGRADQGPAQGRRPGGRAAQGRRPAGPAVGAQAGQVSRTREAAAPGEGAAAVVG
ncbi:hypothetical protein GCM10020229_22850 [Kitasatospora albolonga]